MQRFYNHPITITVVLFLAQCFVVGSSSAQQTVDAQLPSLEQRLEQAGKNRTELELALKVEDADQKRSVEFLILNMPKRDLENLSAEFLLEHVQWAHRARNESAWEISDDLFRNDVLPYANVDETRERWRPEMHTLAQKLIIDCKTPGQAAQRMNEKLFAEVGVKYSTKRKKANQAPAESIDQGLASCTGLSILLVDACRSVNVPARLVGIPKWANKRGNHTWVEVWDDNNWHFTGAAEYNASGLNRAWFQNDASLAQKNSKRSAIYAVSFQKTDTPFPMVWSRGAEPVSSINVTDRYTAVGRLLADDELRVMIRARSLMDEKERVKTPVTISCAGNGDGKNFEGQTKDESADTNDFLTFVLKRNQTYRLESSSAAFESREFKTPGKDQLMVDVQVSDANAKKKKSAQKTANDKRLSKEQSQSEIESQFKAHVAFIQETRAQEWKDKVIKIDDLEMKFDYRTFGEKPADGRSLFISMHGGGGAPARVNEKQWKNQIGLYQPTEGIYLAPRAPTDKWDLWHQSHIDKFFTRIIEDAIAFEGINSNRVYIMGYSAGGDGVYQLAPRMADQLAAAAMMAGHPNDASPLGLRNIGFTIHMGGKDSAYKRNKVAAQWKEKLADLKKADPAGYEHEVTIHPDHGHWMQHDDAVAVPWISKFTRDPYPVKVVWYQSETTHDRFYWLAAEEADQKGGAKMVVSRAGNTFTIEQSEKVDHVIIRLNDSLVDMTKPVVVKRILEDKSTVETTFENITRSSAVIAKTLADRGDINSVYTAEIRVKIR